MADTARTNTYTVTVDGIGPVPVTVTQRGEGRPFLLLHGGAGSQSVDGFAELLSTAEPARVLTPLHPGFGGTPRPEGLDSMPGLAGLYVQLIDDLGLTGVTVIGNSIGGWIAAEIALLASPRVSDVILVDAAGLQIDEHPIVDFFALSMDQSKARKTHLSGGNLSGAFSPAATGETTMQSASGTIAIYTRISKDDKGYAIGVADQAQQCRALIASRFPAAQTTGPGCRCAECARIDVPPDVYCDNDITASGKVDPASLRPAARRHRGRARGIGCHRPRRPAASQSHRAGGIRRRVQDARCCDLHSQGGQPGPNHVSRPDGRGNAGSRG